MKADLRPGAVAHEDTHIQRFITRYPQAGTGSSWNLWTVHRSVLREAPTNTLEEGDPLGEKSALCIASNRQTVLYIQAGWRRVSLKGGRLPEGGGPTPRGSLGSARERKGHTVNARQSAPSA